MKICRGMPVKQKTVEGHLTHRLDSIQVTDYINNDYIVLSSWILGFLGQKLKI